MIDIAISKLQDALDKCYENGDVDDIKSDIEEAIEILEEVQER